MKYRIAPLFCRPWTLNGMSPRLIESHYEHNYGAALNRLNSVTSELEALDVKTTSAQAISRLSRERARCSTQLCFMNCISRVWVGMGGTYLTQ